MKYYLLIYLRKSGQCINKEDAFNNTYFDSSAEVFVTCYERCSKYNTTRNEIIHNSLIA